ncbi:MAG: histidine N-alpha-methyltransferase [Acidimicrobiia bacterium]|nr:MAG: histidine N-alpha-methyltransferase [Acidimicrobiia bacterium]
MSGVATDPTLERHVDPDWFRRVLVEDVRRGLGRHPLRIAPRWLYDDVGSELFERITRLEEYYPTEAERTVLRLVADRVVEACPADTIVELGAGTSDKTRTLLDAFWPTGILTRFIGLDVNEAALRRAGRDLVRRYPGLRVHGIIGDFALHLDRIPDGRRTLVVFLGSTIGNLYVEERRVFLSILAERLRAGGWLLLGVDLVKPVERLVAAYDDRCGVTARFTRNVLEVLNRELGADFDASVFTHVAMWDPTQSRMDLRLRVEGDHHVRIPGAGTELALFDGDEIRVEISTKFTIEGITRELAGAGFAVAEAWTDPRGDVALVLATTGPRS